MEVVDLAQPAGQGKVIEKTLPGGRVLGIVPFGGAEGIRTPDLCDANAALSQLSYSPVEHGF